MSDLQTAAANVVKSWDSGQLRGLGERITALRAALAQEQEEPTGKQSLQVEPVATTHQQPVVETPPSDYRRGYWDGFAIGKREGRIEAEDAAKQAEPKGGGYLPPPLQAEPVPQPGVWMHPWPPVRAQQAEPVQEPVQEPVAWIESPHGAIRANPNYKFTLPSQLLHWQIPLYTTPPKAEPLQESVPQPRVWMHPWPPVRAQQAERVAALYHPCTYILIQGLKKLNAYDVLAEWDKARSEVDALALKQTEKAK